MILQNGSTFSLFVNRSFSSDIRNGYLGNLSYLLSFGFLRNLNTYVVDSQMFTLFCIYRFELSRRCCLTLFSEAFLI